jgi:hypothetical protein
MDILGHYLAIVERIRSFGMFLAESSRDNVNCAGLPHQQKTSTIHEWRPVQRIRGTSHSGTADGTDNRMIWVYLNVNRDLTQS